MKLNNKVKHKGKKDNIPYLWKTNISFCPCKSSQKQQIDPAYAQKNSTKDNNSCKTIALAESAVPGRAVLNGHWMGPAV